MRGAHDRCLWQAPRAQIGLMLLQIWIMAVWVVPRSYTCTITLLERLAPCATPSEDISWWLISQVIWQAMQYSQEIHPGMCVEIQGRVVLVSGFTPLEAHLT